MAELDAAQQQRITKLVDFYREKIPELYGLQEIVENGQYFNANETYYDGGKHTDKHADKEKKLLSLLTEEFNNEFLKQAIPDVYFNPAETSLVINARVDKNNLDPYVFAAMQKLAKEWIINNPDPYSVEALVSRLKSILTNIDGSSERGLSMRGNSSPRELFYEPLPETCIEILAKLYDQAGALAYIEQLLNGDWAKEISGQDSYYGPHNSYQKTDVCSAIDKLYKPLYSLGKFSYDVFTKACQLCPYLLSGYDLGQDEDDRESWGELADDEKQRIEYSRRLAWEITEEFSEEHYVLYDNIERGSTYGGKWVLRSLDYIEKYGIKSLADNLYFSDDPLKSITAMMAKCDSLLAEEDPQEFVAALKNYKPASLLLILPICRKAQDYVLEALGWQDAKPLLQLVKRIAEENGDFYNSENEENGIIEKEDVVEAIDAAGDKVAKKLLAQLRKAKMDYDRTTYLFEAVKGWNEKNIRSSIKRDTQIAIKAYGLLPVTGGEEEYLERYLEFREIEKRAKKYGAERQANTRAAAKVGIANLGKTAGYRDPIRFEWKMEAQLSTEAIPKGRQAIEQWEIELSMEGAEPTVNIYKQDKLLKSVPPAVRKTDTYKELMEWKKQLKSQTTRFKRTLENMMVMREALSKDDLQTLSRLNVVTNLLSKLILKDEDGNYGLFDGDKIALRTLDDEIKAIAGEVNIAHSYDLFNDEILSDWQRYIVRNHIVQPFKQAHRELYIVTPAEENTGEYSNRFAGHVVDGSKASRLLQSRNWQMISGDCAEVYKFYHKDKILAEFEFPDAGHYLAENEIITTDQIYFTQKRERMKIVDVPPVLFSETMRDCDLVVSVAQADEDNTPMTKEALESRANLISMLLEDISLKGVTIEDKFAHIQGKLANYRVHMGSGVIHIVPGNYLCIVPDNAVKVKKDLYLPFADNEPKTSEILSKIIMLSNDSKIKDESILSQIKNGGLV